VFSTALRHQRVLLRWLAKLDPLHVFFGEWNTKVIAYIQAAPAELYKMFVIDRQAQDLKNSVCQMTHT
jgi:hypothetical protein